MDGETKLTSKHHECLLTVSRAGTDFDNDIGRFQKSLVDNGIAVLPRPRQLQQVRQALLGTGSEPDARVFENVLAKVLVEFEDVGLPRSLLGGGSMAIVGRAGRCASAPGSLDFAHFATLASIASTAQTTFRQKSFDPAMPIR
jgi:hypothetical protein